MADIFIVDDDETLQEMLVSQSQRSGHRAASSGTLQEGLQQVAAGTYDIVLLDVQLPDGNGLEYIPQFMAAASAPEVIIITGKGDENGAEKAIVSGAWGYVEKPDIIKGLQLNLARVLQYRQEKNRIKKIPVVLKRDAIIGNNPLLIKCLDQVAGAAVSEASVLITGATGTGKELFAHAIHENSPLADKSFVTVDCAALPDNLIESTLFGYVEGAFTGAVRDCEGLIQQADGGTLFLDEIGELPISTQKSFLRVVQEHSYRPVGATREHYSRFRIIAATNIDIKQNISDGTFRSDLFYRLNALSISLPRLCERKEDIKMLTRFFLAQICDRSNLQCKGISPDFMEHLTHYDWPGNVRELKQIIEHVVANAVEAATLFSIHLPEQFRIRHAREAIQPADVVTSPVRVSSSQLTWKEHKVACEKNYLIDLMSGAGNNVTTACKISKLSRTRLYQLRGKYGLLDSSQVPPV